jgi:EmrB/QacA subfamily drug resistance transporter
MIFLEVKRRSWVALNVSIGVFMSTLDASIVNISLPTITQSLNTHLKAVAWVVMAYFIIITGCLLLMGKLSDLFGRRRIYLFGFSTFTLGSALCGLSPSISYLIGSRMIQGLGASALMAIGPAILTTAYPEDERGKALGILGSIVSVGFITGPILGGFLVEHFGWRSVFFINLPIGVIGIFLSSKFLTREKERRTPRVDLLGAILLFLFLASLLLFINRMGIGWIFLSLFCLGLFIFWEIKSPIPLLDFHLFRKRLFLSSLGAGLLSFWMNGAHNFVLPFFLQNIMKYSPSEVGMLVFPVSLTVMVMAPLGGRISDRVGVRVPATIGLFLTSFIVFSFTFLKTHSSTFEIIWRQIILGIGIGFFNPANNSAIIGSLPREHVGIASSLLAFSRNLGLMVGVAFAEMVIAFRLPEALSKAGKGGPSLEGIQDVWKLMVLFGLIAILLSWVRGESTKVDF